MKLNIINKILDIFRDAVFRSSKKNTEKVYQPPTVGDFEYCVMCGSLTDIPISTPVERRKNYLIGCGQICSKCAKKLQKSAERKTL